MGRRYRALRCRCSRQIALAALDVFDAGDRTLPSNHASGLDRHRPLSGDEQVLKDALTAKLGFVLA
jgi:hypothetical protein